MRRQLSSIVLSSATPPSPLRRYFMSQICCAIEATLAMGSPVSQSRPPRLSPFTSCPRGRPSRAAALDSGSPPRLGRNGDEKEAARLANDRLARNHGTKHESFRTDMLHPAARSEGEGVWPSASATSRAV